MKFIQLTKVNSNEKVSILVADIWRVEKDRIPSHHRNIDCTKIYYKQDKWLKVSEDYYDVLNAIERGIQI